MEGCDSDLYGSPVREDCFREIVNKYIQKAREEHVNDTPSLEKGKEVLFASPEESQQESSDKSTDNEEDDDDNDGDSSESGGLLFDADGGFAKEGEAFENQGDGLVPRYVCLVGKGRCPTYLSKQKIKKHLLDFHNYGEVEAGQGGRPRANPRGFKRTTKEQNRKYNQNAKRRVSSKNAINEYKAKRRYEVSAIHQWEQMREVVENLKVPKKPPLARLTGVLNVYRWENKSVKEDYVKESVARKMAIRDH